MFSVEYFNRAVIITAYNIRRINFRYQVNLRKLIVSAMKQSCDKVILNLVGVRQVDNCAFEMLKQMNKQTENAGIQLCLLNLDNEIVGQIGDRVCELSDCISEPDQLAEYVELMAY